MVTVNAPLILLWATPRSRSTAFVRMIMERGDLAVVHEPFSNLAAVGHFEIAGRSAASQPELFDLLLWHGRTGGRRVFVKETTDYRYDAIFADARLYTEAVNVFMIRDPAAVVASHHAMNPSVQRDEIGFERLHEMFETVCRTTGVVPVVIDGDDLVADPFGITALFCQRTGLPPRPESLRWQAERRTEWSRTQAWHRDVEASTGFSSTTQPHAVRPDNDPRLAALASYHLPFYQALHRHRIRPAGQGSPH